MSIYTFYSNFYSLILMQTSNEEEQSPQRFFKMLEVGDLAFLELIQYAFVIFGITKHGNTTLSHHLVNNALKAYLNERRQVHFKLNTSSLQDARIGAKIQSQTEIPNKFQTPIKIGQSTLYIIDNPGYLNSFGIYRILSNAYFHYRVFQKVKNMKFAFVFDSNTFSTNLKETNTIFKLFFQSFSNFNEVSKQMIKSIAIIFTKVHNDASLKDIHQKLSAYQSTFNSVRAFNKQQMCFLAQLFKQCKLNQKIKLFRKADLNVEIGKCTFLQELDPKLQYFSRKIDETQNLSSLFYNEKRIEMNQIKFSQSKTVLKLVVDQYKKQQIIKLFSELYLRGESIFGFLFHFIEDLFKFLVFQYDASENIEISVDKYEFMKQARQNKLRQMLLKLQTIMIQYNEEQKYKKNRELIIEKYKQKLYTSKKAKTFVDRMDLSTKLQNFCQNYSKNEAFKQRKLKEVLAWKQSVEKIFLEISAIFTNKQQIQKLSRFLYHINTFMNQLIIFSKIVLSNINFILQKRNQFLNSDIILKFFWCLYKIYEQSSLSNQFMGKIMKQHFNIDIKSVIFDTELLVKIYLQKNPKLLANHLQHSELLLQQLISLISLSEQNKIDCVTLMFNILQENYRSFLYFKKIITKNQFETENQIHINQHFNPHDIKRMILSFIHLLKQLRKIKNILCYKPFQKYKNSTYHMSTQCWNYIIQLFLLIIQCENILQKVKDQNESAQKYIPSQQRVTSPSNQQKQKRQQIIQSKIKHITKQQTTQYHQIITQILFKFPNIGFVQKMFNKLINLQKSNFESITPQSCALKINQKLGKVLKGYQTECFILFQQEKLQYAQKIINLLLKYASILNQNYFKEKALAQCHNAIQYTEHIPNKLEQIIDKIQEIQIHNRLGGQWIRQKLRINEFQPSLTTKKQLTKFTKDNPDHKVLDCVKIDIFKNKNT